MSMLRLLLLSLALISGLAQAGIVSSLPPLRVGSIADSRFNDDWTLDGNEMQNTRAKLLNPANFGPGGTVARPISITDTAAPITLDLLSQFDVFFIGYFYRFSANAFTSAELDAFKAWVERGGTMIITCDENDYGQVCESFGHPASDSSFSTNPIVATDAGKLHPLFNGPFGSILQVRMNGTQGAFTVTTGATVLAVDSSVDKKPGIMVKKVGAGRIVLMADVDIVANALSNDGTITNDNDKFLGNLFAFVAPVTRLGSIAESRFQTGWTLNGGQMQNTRAKLLNPMNFGPNGSAGRAIQISDTAAAKDTVSVELLSSFDVFFIGWLNDGSPNAFSAAELQAMVDWVSAGGTMVIACDDTSHDAVCEKFGYPINPEVSSDNPIIPTDAGKAHPLFNGPFGAIPEVRMEGNRGVFAVTAGASVLARDSSGEGRPGILSRSLGAGRLVLIADVDLIASTLSDGAAIENNNDKLMGNLFAFAAALPVNYQGLWWNSPPGSEPGWGINFSHQGDIIFATWFTYDFEGKPWWLGVVATRTGDNVYSGDLFTTVGPAFNAVPFDPALVVETNVGTATFTFSDYSNATFSYSIVTPGVSPSGASKDKAAVAQVKNITRQRFAEPEPGCAWNVQPDLTQATNTQGLWWRKPASSESGWGINLTHQGDIIFATWFTYDLDGKPWWLAIAAYKTAAGVYEGDLFTTIGPPFNAVPWTPAVETTVGTGKFTVVDGNNITFDYTVNGVSQVKALERQVFAAAGTSCNLAAQPSIN